MKQRNVRLSNEEYQQKLDEYKVIEWVLVSDYEGGKKPVSLLHKGCGQVSTYPSAANVFRTKNCRFCDPTKFKKSSEHIEKDLKKLGLELVGNYVNDRTPVAIKYPCGHIHTKTTTQVKQGSGLRCLLCEPRTPQARTPLKQVNEQLLSAEFGRFEIVGEYAGVTNKTDIKCLDCGHVEIGITPEAILKRAGGCQLCGKLQNTESVNHRFVKRILFDLGLIFTTEKTFDGLVSERGFPYRFDFYLPEHNLLIEYDGKYHDQLEYYEVADRVKDKFCADNNIRILRIDWKDKGIIQKILSNIKCNDYPVREYTVSD